MRGDKLLIMKTKNNRPPCYILEDGQYKLIGDYTDPVRKDVESKYVENSIQIILPIESILNEDYMINSDGIIEYRKRRCSYCSSNHIHKKGYTETTIMLEQGIPLRVKVKRYCCRHCFKWSQTEFLGIFEKYSGWPNKLKKIIKKARGESWISLRKLKKLIKNSMGIDISHETIRKMLLVEGEYYYLNEDVKLSGYYSYDEQWEKVNGKWIYYYVLFDIINRVPVATYLSDSITNDQIRTFINKSIPFKDRVAIVTDLKPGYDTVMSELGFVHQHCTFHFLQRVWDKIFKHIDKKLIDYKSMLNNSNEKLSNSQINKMVKKHKKELLKEMQSYVDTIKKLFEQKNLNDAFEYVTFLKVEISKFPDFLSGYLNKYFFPEYRKFLHFLEKDHIGKLDQYNNKIENFNKITMPRYEKKTYRTRRGLWSALMHKKDVWIENRKKEHCP